MKKKLILPLIVLLILVVTFGLSVAFFSYAKIGSKESSIQIGELTFKYTEISGKGHGINLDDAFPISDSEGKVLDEYFDFKVEANLTRSDIAYRVELDTTLADLPAEGIKVYLTEIVDGNEVEINSIINTLSTYGDSTDGKVIYTEIIPRNTKNYVKNFRLRLWIDENVDWTSDSYMGHSATYKVNVKANSDSSMAATDTVTDKTTSIERVVANNKYLFTESSDTGVDYEVTVPYTIDNVDIEVYESNTQATSTVTPLNSLSGVSSKVTNQNIHTGNNYFKVVTTSSNGNATEEYILKVVKERDTRSDLLALGIEGYSLTPTFDPEVTSYTITLEEPTINITGSSLHNDVVISGLGEKNLSLGGNVFSVTVTPNDTTATPKTYTITVTNEQPIAPTIMGGTGTTWVSTNQTITLANPNTAFAISGIDHYDVYDTNTSTAPTTNTVATTTTASNYTVDTDGTHYIYYRTVSNKGYKSEWSSPQVVYRDATAPTDLKMVANDNKASGVWHSGSYTITVSATKAGSSNLIYYYGTTNNPTTTGSSISASGNTTGTTYYAKACNQAGVCTNVGSYVSKIDSSAPSNLTLTISDGKSSGAWHTANFTISFSATKNGGSSVVYYYGTSSNPTTSGSSITVNTSATSSAGVTYYIKACNQAGVCTGNTSYVAKLDKDPPSAPTTMEYVYSNWTRYVQGTVATQTVYAAYASGNNGPSGATDNIGVVKYQISTNNSTWYDYSYDYNNSLYYFSTSGTHIRYFRACDAVGNCGSSISRKAIIQ